MLRIITVLLMGILISFGIWHFLMKDQGGKMAQKSLPTEIIPNINFDKIEKRGVLISNSIVNIFSFRESQRQNIAERSASLLPPPPPLTTRTERKVPALSSSTQDYLPFNATVLGYSIDGEDHKVFLQISQDLLVINVGSVIDNRWEVTEINDQQALLMDNNSGRIHSLKLNKE